MDNKPVLGICGSGFAGLYLVFSTANGFHVSADAQLKILVYATTVGLDQITFYDIRPEYAIAVGKVFENADSE